MTGSRADEANRVRRRDPCLVPGRVYVRVARCVAVSRPSTVSSKSAAPVSRSVGEEVAEARSMLAKVPIGGRGAKTGYQRTDDFGEAWLDVDGNGCRTRDDVLARDLVVTAQRNSLRGDGRHPHRPLQRQADDVQQGPGRSGPDRPRRSRSALPGSSALRSGRWGSGSRSRTTPRSCSRSTAGSTRTRATQDRTRGSHRIAHYRCTYVIRFTRIAYTYGLRITASMRDAIARQLDACRDVVGDPAGLQPLPATVWPRAARIDA